MTIDEMKEKLKTMIKPGRYQHSLGVCETAAEMADRFGEDRNKAYLAGLLHDCAKGLTAEECIRLWQERKIDLSPVEAENYALHHAPAGVYIARTVFGIDDQEILNAIRYHTVGRAGMSRLEKIIYAADMIEPGRDFPGVDALRKAARQQLDKTVWMCAESTISHNLKRQQLIHSGTIDLWNDLMRRKEDSLYGSEG